MPNTVTPEALHLPPTLAIDITDCLDDVTDRAGDAAQSVQ